MNKNKFLLAYILLLSIITLATKIDKVPIEELSISSAVGYDIVRYGDEVEYIVPISMYIFQENKETLSKIFTGKASSIAMTRQDRQLTQNTKFLLGVEKVYIIGEEAAHYGIRDIIQILFKNPYVNDIGYVTVCSGKAIDMLKHKITGYPSIGDYVEGIIRSLDRDNFFPNDFKLFDEYSKLEGVGRSAILPFLEMGEKGPVVTGVAIFNKDKMIDKLDMKDTRIINLMRPKPGKGTFVFQASTSEYADYNCSVKRKVDCSKEGDKLNFVINLKFNGDIVSDEYKHDLRKNPESKKKLEEDLALKIEKQCMDFIWKMQNDYKVDCIELGSVAASKYGRINKADWNNEVVNSNITVKVQVSIDMQGRGDY